MWHRNSFAQRRTATISLLATTAAAFGGACFLLAKKPLAHIVTVCFSQRCAATISLLAEMLRGDSLQETGLARRLLGILARLSRRRPAQEAIAASCFADWAAEVLNVVVVDVDVDVVVVVDVVVDVVVSRLLYLLW